jgi:hypothetical protein
MVEPLVTGDRRGNVVNLPQLLTPSGHSRHKRPATRKWQCRGDCGGQRSWVARRRQVRRVKNQRRNVSNGRCYKRQVIRGSLQSDNRQGLAECRADHQ